MSEVEKKKPYEDDDYETIQTLGERVFDDGLYNLEAALDDNGEREISMHYDDPIRRRKEMLVYRRLRSRAVIDACSQAEKGARMKRGVIGKENMMDTDSEDRRRIEELLEAVTQRKRDRDDED